MSGFEVVGVVLGAIPLLISGLEHYAEGIHTIKAMWNYEAVVKHLVEEFQLAQSIFRHSCEDLLMPILPDAEAADLLEGGSPNWNDPGLDQQLRERLGPDYEVYIRYVRNLRRRIEHFSRKLGLDQGTMSPPWILKAGVDKGLREKFFRDSWRRIKGGFDTSAVNRLLAEIQSSVNQLAKFTKGSTAFAPKRTALRTRQKTRDWLRFQDHARRLSKSLDSHWCCACVHSHRASLRLDIRPMSSMQGDEEFKFKILFSNDSKATSTVSTSSQWKWLQVDIRTMPSSNHQANLTNIPPQGKGKRVNFNIPVTSKPSRATPPNPPLQTSSQSASSRISDLCRILSQRPRGSSSVGYFDDHDFQQHVIVDVDGSDLDEQRELVCFNEILRLKFAHGLGVKEKYALALTIASAVLHLQATPWLKDKWCLDDIHFIRNTNVSRIYDQAYVTKGFFLADKHQVSTSGQDQTAAQPCPCIANETIFALGVALIEISFGVPILSLKEKADPDISGIPDLLQYCIATRLIHQDVIKDREHDAYAEVVARCVKGLLSTSASRLSLEDAKVQQSFYEDVILPLHRLNQILNDENDLDAT